MKNYKLIDQLLVKYFEGGTSLQEESVLRKYFMQDNVANHHEVYRAMFNFMSVERGEKKPAGRVKYMFLRIAAAACIILSIGLTYRFLSASRSMDTQSLVYVDGKRVNDIDILNSQALISIRNIANGNENMIDAQVDILDNFVE